jgi:hypothetical protein
MSLFFSQTCFEQNYPQDSGRVVILLATKFSAFDNFSMNLKLFAKNVVRASKSNIQRRFNGSSIFHVVERRYTLLP